MKEIDFLIEKNSGGVVHYQNGDALQNNLLEWLHTRQGEVWGNPAWGNTLDEFRHLPKSTTLENAIRMNIVSKLRIDLPSIDIYQISVNFVEFDRVLILIQHQFGVSEAAI